MAARSQVFADVESRSIVLVAIHAAHWMPDHCQPLRHDRIDCQLYEVKQVVPVVVNPID